MRILVAETTWTTSTVAVDLKRQGFLVTRADTGEDTLLFARDAVHDAVIIDADLGDIPAARALKSIREVRPNLPLIVVAKGADRDARRVLFEAGADHVATEIDAPEELAARLRAFARRTAGYTSPLVHLGPITVDLNARHVRVGDISVALTPSEYEFLEHLALRRHSVVSRDEILTHLYGLDDGPDPKILDVHLTRIRKKLRSAGANPRQIRTMNGRGFALEFTEIATPEAA